MMKITSASILGTLLSFAAVTATHAAEAGTADRAAADAALADEIERLARRDVEGLASRKMPDGTVQMDLQGRFQQVPIARLGDDGEIFVGCVGTLDEAQRFFGRDLRSGEALPKSVSGPVPDGLVARAARSGITPMQQRFYESLIDQAAMQRPKSAVITIVNADGPGEGFNDATAATPEGGNNGTTRGQQRLNVFNQAAAIWGAFLDSPVPIAISAQFEPLQCSVLGATLGQAGPTSAANLTGGGFVGTGTVFPIALANKLVGNDANGAAAEITATFNSSIDAACLGAGTRFYYGLDNATPAGTVNLLVVLLHELGHGLGSLSFTGQNGAFAGGVPDIWARYQFDRSVNLLWTQMTDAQRAASTINPNNVLWDGANVRIASGFLGAARDSNGRVELFTPSSYQLGSSVSHWNATAAPNLLMEPLINPGLPLDLDLTRQQMRDIGWFRDGNNDGVADTITGVQPSGSSIPVGNLITISWTNNGGFNRNVDIELSTNGGATFPTVIANNVSNSAAFNWFVPNTPTAQARIRVRETGFAEPAATSASNFEINTAPTFSPAAAVTRERGSAAGAAVAIGTAADAITAPGALVVTEFIGGTATGITVGGISNSNGAITATLAASCSATAGTVRFRVSDGNLNGFGNLQVNVDNNIAPTLSYAAQSGAGGGGLVVNPATGPTDNGSIASTTLLSQGTYAGTVSVGATNGVVTLSNLAPAGTHTITVRATDNCGSTSDASFQLTITGPVNTAPTFTPGAAITRQQGSPSGATVPIGTAADAQTAAGSLTVVRAAGGTGVGIVSGNITNANGAISTFLRAECSAVSGTARFQVSDGSLTGTGDLQVNVTADTAPTLTYAAQSAVAGSGLTVNPATGPTDNGTVASTTLLSQGTYAGTVSVGGTNGVVSLSNVGPVGVHTITVRATDNCGLTRDASFQLTVGSSNTAPTFTPVAPLTRQQGELEDPPITVGTVTDAQTAPGNLIVSIVSGTALGVAFGSPTNTNGTITTALQAQCNGTSGFLRYQVSDGALTSTGDLQITVLPNTPPTVTYGAQAVLSGGAVTVTPATGPVDNGRITATALLSTGTYTGGAVIGAMSGVVSLTNAAPVGSHTLTVRTTDNCGATTDTPVSVQVNGDTVFGDGFEPVLVAN